jgi:hypothetical protein
MSFNLSLSRDPDPSSNIFDHVDCTDKRVGRCRARRMRFGKVCAHSLENLQNDCSIFHVSYIYNDERNGVGYNENELCNKQ